MRVTRNNEVKDTSGRVTTVVLPATVCTTPSTCARSTTRGRGGSTAPAAAPSSLAVAGAVGEGGGLTGGVRDRCQRNVCVCVCIFLI